MNVLEAAIEWIAPPECVGCGAEGSSLCAICAELEIVPYGQHCGLCGKVSSGGQSCETCRHRGSPRHIWISTDYSGLSKKLLQTYKFQHRRAVSIPLAQILSSTLSKYTERALLARHNYLVVPVPTATSRVRARGFDHTALLASQAAKYLKIEFYKGLGRLGQGRQVGARRSVRLAQQAGNYIVRNPGRIKGRNILLVDDVITTGATLIAARQALRQAGAKQIDALVFAKRL